MIHIDGLYKESITSIEIISLDGKILLTIQDQFNNINLNQLNSGLYIIRITLIDGTSSQAKVFKL